MLYTKWESLFFLRPFYFLATGIITVYACVSSQNVMQHGKVTLHEHVFIFVIHLKDLSGTDKRSALHISYEKFLNSVFFVFHPLRCFFLVFIYCKYKCTVYRADKAFETQRLEPSVVFWTVSTVCGRNNSHILKINKN